jgi:methionine-R-sulfoxide reductase
MRSLIVGSLLAFVAVLAAPKLFGTTGLLATFGESAAATRSSGSATVESTQETTAKSGTQSEQAKNAKAEQSTTANEDDKMVSVKVFNEQGKLVGPISMAKVIKTEQEWKRLLTPEQFDIARQSGTERPFCGTLLDNKKEGVYACVCCNLPLFSSDAKFNSGTGWPSFFQPISTENVSEKTDRSHGMVRVEINCARCDAHLGHVFDDGPPPTGRRHCLNSESLKFTDADKLAELADPAAKETTAPATDKANTAAAPGKGK